MKFQTWNVGLQEARQYQRKSQKELFGKEG
jgi:hypothetical protein